MPNISSSATGDRFGWSIALHQEGSTVTLVVGAPYEDGDRSSVLNSNNIDRCNDNKLNSGAAYVYTLASSGKWVQQAVI